MTLESLNSTITNNSNPKIVISANRLNNLLEIIKDKNIPNEQIPAINKLVQKLNDIKESDKKLNKLIRKTDCAIVSLLEKELKFVPKNYYRNMWLALGMSIFGLPLGVAFSAALNNYGFIGIGLPIGMVIGMAYGTKLDKKAACNNLQLNISR